MTFPLANHYVDVAVRIKDLIVANKDVLDPTIDSVFYGDQDLIPNGKTVCVQPGPIRAQLQGSSHMVLNAISTYVLVYVSKIQDIQQNRLTADLLSKALAKLLHGNLTLLDPDGLNGIVIHGFVEESDPGYTIRKKNLFESVRMTHTCTTKTMLSQ
jgi:hypothetical protein